MKTSLTITFLSLLLLIGPLGKAVCAQQPAADVEKTLKVKSEVAKRVTNKKTRVKIKLHNGDELKGRITRADENGFAVTDEKTGKQTELTYNEVATVKGRGGLSLGWKIGIVAIVGVVVFAAVVAWGFTHIDPSVRCYDAPNNTSPQNALALQRRERNSRASPANSNALPRTAILRV